MTTATSPASPAATGPVADASADVRLRPHLADDESTAFGKPRLDADQIAEYRREGFVVYDAPVLRRRQFDGLRTRFEELLEEHTRSGYRPESMDTPHFGDHRLFEWLFCDEILDLVEPLIGPDIALFSSHFLAKPPGNGKRVPWHEDSFYWRHLMEPMHVCTVWLAIDPSVPENGCMNVIPRALHGYSEYADVDAHQNVFATEIKWLKNVPLSGVQDVAHRPDGSKVTAVQCVLRPNEASLHDARLIHGSDPNLSPQRRCGYTMRFIPSSVKYIRKNHKWPHQIYLARGHGHPENEYADPTRNYPDMFAARFGTGNSH